MFKKLCVMALIVSSINAATVEEAIKQRNLFENQKNIYKEKEIQKSDEIFHYDVKKPEIQKSDEGQCFEIKQIVENGITLIEKEKKEEIFNKYINRCDTVTDLKNLINELTTIYIDRGYVTSKVYLKPQNISGGVIEIYAIEGKVEDFKNDDLYIKSAFFNQKEDYLNLRDLEVGIENINRLKSNSAKLKLEPGTQPGLTIIDVENNKSAFPINGYVNYNNFGSNPTGEHQFALNTNIENLLNINDIFSINYNTTDKHNTKNNSIGDSFTYSFPIGRLMYSFSYGESKYNQIIPTNLNEYHSSGKNKNYTMNLDYELFHNQHNKISLGYLINHYQSKNYLENNLIETSTYNLSKTGVRLNYLFQTDTFLMSSSLQHVRGVHWFNNTNPTSLDDKYKIFIIDNYISKSFDNFRYSLDFHYQRSSQQLFSVNQISIGGAYSVRGYNEDGLNGNTGYYYRNELAYALNNEFFSEINPLPYIGLDGGWIKNEEDTDGGYLLGELFGLKLNYKSLYYDMYYSKALRTKDVTSNENFFGFNVNYRF